MFDINNEELIMKLIEQKDDDDFVIPLYVKIYNNIYSITELDKIEEYDPSSFKIGFGSLSGAMFVKNNFPNMYTFDFNIVKTFRKFDNVYNIDVRYIIFESSYVDDIDNIHKQINRYVNMIEDYVVTRVNAIKKERIRKLLNDNS